MTLIMKKKRLAGYMIDFQIYMLSMCKLFISLTLSLLWPKSKTLLAVLLLWKTLIFQFIQEHNIPWNTLRRLFFMQVMHFSFLNSVKVKLLLFYEKNNIVSRLPLCSLFDWPLSFRIRLILLSLRLILFLFKFDTP